MVGWHWDRSFADFCCFFSPTFSKLFEPIAKSRKTIRQARRENPDCCLVVCGCAAEHHKENLIDLDIDILLGNKDKSKIVLLVNDYLKNRRKIVNFYIAHQIISTQKESPRLLTSVTLFYFREKDSRVFNLVKST